MMACQNSDDKKFKSSSGLVPMSVPVSDPFGIQRDQLSRLSRLQNKLTIPEALFEDIFVREF